MLATICEIIIGLMLIASGVFFSVFAYSAWKCSGKDDILGVIGGGMCALMALVAFLVGGIILKTIFF